MATLSDITQSHWKDILFEMRTLSDTVTAESVLSDDQFPFVTVPFYELHARKLVVKCAFETVTFAPLVADSEVGLWETYSVEKQGWIDESRELVLKGGGTLEDEVEGGILPIHGEDGEFDFNSTIPGMHAPVWQSSPPPFDASFVNLDFFALPFAGELYRAMNTLRGEWICLCLYIGTCCTVLRHCSLHYVSHC